MNQGSSAETNLEALRRWVLAFCVIRFDLEQGQIVEECYPSGALPQSDEPNIAFSSFPDSMSHNHQRNRSSIQDSIFFFRVRSSTALGGYLYGYVFNRQRQDERLKRGGEQKSVVILSFFPYSSVFRPLLQILGPLCFDVGRKSLELVAAHVGSWPAPVLGKLMELPIGSAVLKVHLPPWIREGVAVAPLPPSNSLIPQGLFHDADLFGIFRGILLQLWVLWELVLLGEPIMVIALTPPQCSEAVAGLVSLVAPLLCSVDYRPYFTIHDPDFAALNSLGENDPFPPMILGVTNLFFLKSLHGIPHVISVGSPSMNSAKLLQSSARKSPGLGKLNLEQLSLNKFSPVSLLNSIKLRREGPLSLMTEHKEAIWSAHRATTKPDTSILNRLIDAGMSPRIEESMSVVNNEILRRHFLELTTNFLAPFGPYMRSSTPLEGSSPFSDPPPLPPFRADEFLNNLAARGPGKFLSKRMRANWLDLYRWTFVAEIASWGLCWFLSFTLSLARFFLKGRNFMPWFQRRRVMAEEEQQKLWKQARMKADIKKLILEMSELEVVECFNAVEHQLLKKMQVNFNGSLKYPSFSN